MWRLLLSIVLTVVSTGLAAADVRIKDITSVRGVRSNQLVGYGLVAGLKGTGDSLRSAPFTEQSVTSMLERMGVNIRGMNARTRNIAAVLVTAELPAFAVPGNRIDVTVTSLGDASSLAGGTLIMTPLQAADEQIYAVAQGSVMISGFEARGQNERVTLGVPTAGRISGGALVERAWPRPQQADRIMHLELNNPDFSTAIAVVDAVNAYTLRRFRARFARENGPSSVAIEVPRGSSPSRFLAEIGQLQVEPDTPARIIVDERTGTIVISRNVKVSRVAVTHGNLTVRVTETPSVSQPAPFSKGKTVVTNDTSVVAQQSNGNFAMVEGVDLQTLVTGLNRMGLKPSGIIAILQAIKSAGALQAELVVQ
ncbi:MAG: flagellar basal body P-ring protein FlgI [Hyphomicrobiaceae bacterium]